MTVHIVGAGLAGLAAAVRLTGQGRRVVIYEAAGHAGGRCRSFHDDRLDRRIDNGNHLLLSGNKQAMAYLGAVESVDSFAQGERAVFAFLDLKNGQRWDVKPGRSRLPFWLFCKRMRVPESTALDYLQGLKLAFAGADATIAATFDKTRPLFRKFWEPLSVAVLNTNPDDAAAKLLWPVLKQTFGGGEAACRPCIAKQGLSESLIDPARRYIELREGRIEFSKRLKTINFRSDGAESLVFADSEIKISNGDAVILAVPADIAAQLLPGSQFPSQFRAIVNGHFLLSERIDHVRLLGLVGGVSQWLFVRDDVASITISAADNLVEKSSQEIAATLWPEVSKALSLAEVSMGPYRIIKEKHATFAQTPEQVRLRPGTKTKWANVFLAGDWTATGLPATIEGAITSGHLAAEFVNAGRVP